MDEQLTQPEDFTDRFNFTTLDRRRGGRASHALILKGAEFLPAPDRALLKAVFQDGRSAAELARLNPHIKPRALSYRVRLLARRTLSPEFAFVTAHRRRWGRTRRKVRPPASCTGSPSARQRGWRGCRSTPRDSTTRRWWS